MQNANCLDLVLGHCLVYQLVSSYVSQQIRLTHLRAARELVSSSSSSTHHPDSHPHSKSLTKSQTDSSNDSLTDSSSDSPLIEPARSHRLAARLVRSLLEAYLSICWFGHQLFASRTADSAAGHRYSIGRLHSIGHFHSTGHLHLIGRLYSINSDPFGPLSKLSNPTRSSSSFSSKSSLRSSCISSISLSSDHKPSALSPPHSAPRHLATSFSATFSEPNRFNFLLNFTAAFVHMLDVALKLFILTGASTFMGKIIGRRTLFSVKIKVEL